VEIAAHYGVSCHTVRRAMAELTARGLVRGERGSGTYVETDKLDYRIGARTVFFADAGYLQPSVHRPILIADSVDVTADGKPILARHDRFAADRVALVVEF
jgi:DNA-binding GntR family transcriptional regulator